MASLQYEFSYGQLSVPFVQMPYNTCHKRMASLLYGLSYAWLNCPLRRIPCGKYHTTWWIVLRPRINVVRLGKVLILSERQIKLYQKVFTLSLASRGYTTGMICKMFLCLSHSSLSLSHNLITRVDTKRQNNSLTIPICYVTAI